MVPHDTPPRCTVLGVHQRKKTKRHMLLCKTRARHFKNAVCLLDSEDDLDQLLIVLLPVVFILVFFLCLLVLQSLFIVLFLTKALFFL